MARGCVRMRCVVCDVWRTNVVYCVHVMCFVCGFVWCGVACGVVHLESLQFLPMHLFFHNLG